MLYIIAVVIIVLWALGLIAHVAGGFVNLLLVVAAAIIIYNFLVGRKSA